MLSVIKKVVKFRVAQKATKGIARSIGLRKAAPLIGLVGGFRAMRRR